MKICQLRNIINSLVKEALAEPTTVPPPTKPAPVRQPTSRQPQKDLILSNQRDRVLDQGQKHCLMMFNCLLNQERM